VKFWLDRGTLGENKSASWFRGMDVELFHKLTLGLGSLSQ